MDEERISVVFAALADATRRDMVARLADGDLTVGELADGYDVSTQAVSKHVKVLEDAAVVTRPGGTHRSPVHLDAQVLDLATGWLERYRRRAQDRHRRLDAVLADMDQDTRTTHSQEETA